MTTNINNENIALDSPEQLKSEIPSFDKIAADLLNDASIGKLPIEDQGRVIADRFVGALVRRGPIETASDTFNAADILHLMDNVGKLDGATKTITRTDGLRAGVLALSADERVGQLFGRLSSTLETSGASDGEEQFTLTSAAQIEGYLLAGGDKNNITDGVGGVHMSGSQWIGVVTEHTERMSKNPHLSWLTSTKARELVTSSAPLIYHSGRDWQMASASAERAGIDMNLLKRSAEKLQEQTVKTDHDLGNTALFLATGGKIASYKQDLNRRSRY
ncbi:MAG: hypothetical protein V4611_03140 [Patescibacteria group bacterium]